MDKYFKASASYATNEARLIGFTTKYEQSNDVEAASLFAPHKKCWANVLDAVKYKYEKQVPLTSMSFPVSIQAKWSQNPLLLMFWRHACSENIS